MSERDSMLSALDQLEQLRNQLTALSRENAEGWKRQYVDIRRQLQATFSAFNKACDAWFAAGADGGDARRLRELTGVYRARLAEHQARFPVVSIDPRDSGYWTSMRAIDVAQHDLAAFVRSLNR